MELEGQKGAKEHRMASLSFDDEVGFDALGMDFDDVLEEAVHGVADLPPLPSADLEMMDCAGGVGGEDVLGSGGAPPLPPLPDCDVPHSLLEFNSAGAGEEEESDSSSSSEEESDDDEDDDVNDENAHLSDYERLRLANIKRNEARLARLGLLTTSGTSAFGNMSNNDNKNIPPKQVGGDKFVCFCSASFSRQFFLLLRRKSRARSFQRGACRADAATGSRS